MERLCKETGKQFSAYDYAKVLWIREQIKICPHCKIMKDSMGFSIKHPRVNSDKKNE